MFEYLIVILLGLIIGSFCNVVIYRLPLGKSIITPGSHCRVCAAPPDTPQCLIGQGVGASIKSIHSPRRPTEQGQLLRSRSARGDALKGIPQRGPAHPHLFHGEIALEHAAVGAESFDAGRHVGAPVRRQLGGGHRG